MSFFLDFVVVVVIGGGGVCVYVLLECLSLSLMLASQSFYQRLYPQP